MKMPRSLLSLCVAALLHAVSPTAWSNDIGQVAARSGETLANIARRLAVPLDGLAAANAHLDLLAPLHKGLLVRVPRKPLKPNDAHDGLVVNLAELRVYHFDDGRLANVFPIGIGRAGNDTPVADTVVTRVDADPSWRPPASIHDEYRKAGRSLPAVVPPGPGNPLGGHALRLALPGYLLHGTNSPDGVGLRVSHGCIRLYNEHIAILARTVSPGTRVRIVNQPIKWRLDEFGLVMEAYRPLTGRRYGGTAPMRKALAEIRSAVEARGLSVAQFDSWLEEQHAKRELFTGLLLTVPVDSLTQ